MLARIMGWKAKIIASEDIDSNFSKDEAI